MKKALRVLADKKMQTKTIYSFSLMYYEFSENGSFTQQSKRSSKEIEYKDECFETIVCG